jgi:hypothetical protein
MKLLAGRSPLRQRLHSALDIVCLNVTCAINATCQRAIGRWTLCRCPSMKRSLAFLLCMILMAPTQAADGETGDPPDWSDVSGIFVERCVMCHSAQGAALGLRLDTYEAAIAGGANGAVVIPGDAERSELVRRLRGDSLPRMPFLSYPLTGDQIDLIKRWVDAGLQGAE